MISEAIFLSLMLVIGFVLMYKKFPRWLKRLISKHYIITDAILCWSTFSILGYAMVGIMTAAIVSLLVSLWLIRANSLDITGRKG